MSSSWTSILGVGSDILWGLNDNERNMVDIASGGTFVKTYANKSMQFMERLVENWAYK